MNVNCDLVVFDSINERKPIKTAKKITIESKIVNFQHKIYVKSFILFILIIIAGLCLVVFLYLKKKY